MLTVEDIRNVEFTKSLGGYKTTEVDVFIDQCADTVSALIEERNSLNKKLEILADKLVEYKNDEDNIRTALLSAQRLGDTIVREANQKSSLAMEDAGIRAEKILKDAEEKARGIVETAKGNIKDEEQELIRLQREVAAFKNRMLAIYREHLSLIDVLPEEPAEPSTEEMTAEMQETQADVEDKDEEVAAAVADETPALQPKKAEQPLEMSREESPAEKPDPFTVKLTERPDEEAEKAVPQVVEPKPRPVSRFADLKFGEDYDISEDEQEAGGRGFFKRKK